MAVDFSSIVNRAIEIITNPKKSWRIVRDDPARGREVVFSYVFFLALLPAGCGFLGRLGFGSGFLYSLISAVFMLGVFVGSVLLLGFLVNALAPFFGTIRNENAAFKLVVYSSTPIWVAGVLTLFPALALPAILIGFGYAGYLFHLGCQALLGTPKEKASAFTVASIVVWLLVVLFAGWIVLQITGVLFAPALVLNGLSGAPSTAFGS